MSICYFFQVLKANSTFNLKIDIIKEAIAMSLFKHENLIEFHGVCYEHSQPKYIILEYMNQGDLLSFLRDENTSKVIINNV